MTKPWSEVAASEGFKSLPPEQQDGARRQYFDDVVAPKVPAQQRDIAWDQFATDTGVGRRSLPAGVEPSRAGGGRGSVNPGVISLDNARPRATDAEIDSMLRTPINNDVQQAPPTVLEGMTFDKPQFDPAEGERLSNRSYAEATPAPGEPRRAQPVMKPSTGPDRVTDATYRGQALQDASLPVRAAFKAVSGVAKGAGGLIRGAGDLVGSTALQRAGVETTKGADEFQRGMGDTGSVEGFGPKSPVAYLSDMAEGAASSLGQSAAYASMFGAKAVIPLMSVMSAGEQYDKARTQGLDPAMALAGALPKGAFEAIGEKFSGLDKVAGAMGTILTKGASAEAKKGAADILIKSGIKEIPGEVITYLGQTGVDLLPGIGLNPDLTMGQFVDGLRDTVVQAGMMGTAMGAGGAALRQDPRIKRLRDAGETGAADLLQARLDKENTAASVDTELAGIAPLADFAATPEYQADYRALRTEGVKPVEAAGRSAVTSNFRTLATVAGMPEKAVTMALETAKKTGLDKLPGFFQRYTQALAKRGLIQAPEGADALGTELEAARDQAMNAAMGVTLEVEGGVRDKMAAVEALESDQNQAPAPATPTTPAIETIAAGDGSNQQPALRESLSNRGGSDASVSSDFRPTGTPVSQGDGSVNVPAVGAMAPVVSGDAAALEGLVDGPIGNTDGQGNLVDGGAAVTQGDGNVNGPAQLSEQVLPNVGSLVGQDEVVGGVVEPVLVPVVDDLGGEQATAKDAFNNQPVLEPLAANTVNLDADQAVRGLVPREGADVAAGGGSAQGNSSKAKPNITPGAPENVQNTPVRPRGQAEATVQAAADQAPAPEGSDAQGPAAAGADTGDAALEAPRVILGRNNVPLTEGGKAFKTRKAADDAKKQQPMMRVIRADGGYALTEKTPAQLAAQEKAARRLRNPQTSPKGQPIPAHAMIAAAGGLAPAERVDMAMQGNVRIGNRSLFADEGKGLTIERATEKLIEDGYLPEDAGHDEARALIKRSLTQPQYTAEGFERMAEAETQARFDAAMTEDEAIDDAVAQIEALSDNQFSELADADIPDFDAASNTTLEAVMRDMGFTDQEIQDAVADQSRIQGSDSQGDSGAVEGAAAEAQTDPAGRDEAPGPTQEVSPAPAPETPADAGVSVSAPAFESKLRTDGTLAITGDAKAIRELLTAIPAKSLAGMKGGILVGRTQADKAAAILRGEKPKLTAREAAEAGQASREADKKAKAAAARAKPASEGIKVGSAPGSAEPVTVRDGVVYIGKYEALDFDSAEPVRVKPGASDNDIVNALKVAGALARGHRVFGLAKVGDDLTFAVKLQAGEITLHKNPTFTEAKQAAETQPLGQAVMVSINRDDVRGNAEPTRYGAWVSNGDGTAEYVERPFPESRKVLDAAAVEALYQTASAGKQATREKQDAARADRLAAIEKQKLRVGVEWKGAKNYVQGKSGATTFSRSKITAIDDNGFLTVESVLPGSSKLYVFTSAPDSRIFENYPTVEGLTAPTRQDVLDQQDRKDNADSLDQREQIEREASGQTLTSQAAPEQRTDTSGDMFAAESDAATQSELGNLSRAQQAAGEFFAEATPAAHRAEADRISKVAAGLVKLPDIKRRYEALAESHRLAADRKEDGQGSMFARQGFDADAFARMFRPPSAMAVTDVQKAVDKLTSAWKSGPAIKVVTTPADLPIAAPADARGLIHNGTAYIVARNHINRDAVAKTLGHEAIGHYGLWRMLGDDGTKRFNRNLQLALKSGNVPLNKLRAKVRAAYVDDKGRFNLSAAEESSEIAAFAVEAAIDPATGEFKPGFGFVKEVYAKVAEFLRSLGIDIKFTNSELHGMLMSAMRGLKAGAKLDGGGQVLVAAARTGEEGAEFNALDAISRNDDLFSLPKSDKTTVEAITAENDPAITVKKADDTAGRTIYTFTLPDGKTATMSVRPFNPYATPEAPTLYGYEMVDGFPTAFVTERPGNNPEDVGAIDDVWIDVSRLKQGGQGAKIYNIAATYAHNTGKVFIGDPAGLNDDALRRRTEQMLSSALKFGTTQHIAPHPRQVQGDKSLGIPPLKWTYGDDLGNIRSLIDTTLKSFDGALTNPFSYDIRTGTFIDSNGDPIDREGMEAIVRADGQMGRRANAGDRTFARNAVLRAIWDDATAARPTDTGTDSARRADDGSAIRPTGAGRRDIPGNSGSAANEGNAERDALVRQEGGASSSRGQGNGILGRLVGIASESGASTRGIFYARGTDGVDQTPPAGTAFARGTGNLFQPNIWTMPEATRTDRVIYELQDGKVDLKRAQEAIKASGQDIREEWDARLAETLYPGRVAYRSATFLDVEAKPLLEAMASNKVGMDELADYLHARGAEERNAQIAKVNPSMPDGGAGTNTKGVLMTDQAARDYLAAVNPTRKLVLDAMAKRVDTITAGTRALLVAEGLEKQETIDAWEGAYKNYVPMFRDEAETAMPPHPQGAGFQVKGNASRRATGSTKEVTNILAHVLMQREAAITRAEKNRVALALYGQALSHPNPDFWTTIRPSMKPQEIADELVAMGVDPMTAQVGMEGVPTIRTVDPITQKVVDRPNPIYKNLPGAIPLKVNGADRVLMINVKTERGQRLATSLKNLDGLTQLDIAGNIIGKSTRWLAAVNTQYNPAFGLVNLTRDTLGGAINLGSTELRGNALKVLANTPKAILGIARELASGGQTGTWQSLYRQFQADGGQTGFKENFRDPHDRARAVEKELASLGTSKLSPGRAAHAILDLLDGFNTTLENAVRLSAYKAALDKGMSRAEAARLGRELTVDFNRKGRAGREVGPLYAFFNASVQGIARTTLALKGPTGGKIIAGGISLGILQALMLAAAGYEDDEIPEFVKTRALIIPLFGREKNYVSIPYPLGLHVLPNTGRVLAELTLNGGKDIVKRSVNAIGEIAGAFNPLGGGNIFTADGALKTVAPTTIDPLIEIGFNRNFAGGTIEKAGFGTETDNRPGVARTKESTARSTTGQAYMGISKAINKLTGGTDYEAGLASPTPERVRYLAQTVGGGVLREFEKTINSSTAAARGEKVKMSGIPVVGRFYGEVDDDQVQVSRYYQGAKKMRKVESSVKAARKAGDDDAADAIEDRNPEAVLIRSFNRTQRGLAALNKEAVSVVRDVKEMKQIDEDRAQLMRDFNTDLAELEREAGKITLADRLKSATRPKVAEMTP